MARPTPSQARTNRLNRQAQRRALVAARTAAHTAHRSERHTVASHLRHMGVDDQVATGMAATLRKKIHGAGVKGIAKKDGVRRPCVRYSRGQVLAALAAYRPRKAEFKATRTSLLTLAA